MFYQTQVKSIIQGGVIDVHGKELSLIGNKLVKQGDFIWTDGKVVFGNTPIRGGGILHAEQSGIPILANNLRGYFDKVGNFKSFGIAQDDWITNSNKYFTHGLEHFNENKVIDAYITDKGKKLIVTDGFYHDNHTFDFSFIKICFVEPNAHYDSPPYSARTAYPSVFEQTLGSDIFPKDKLNALLYVDDKKVDEIDLEIYSKDVEQRALQVASQIMEQDYQTNDFTLPVEYLGNTLIYSYRGTPIEEITKYHRDITWWRNSIDRPAESPPDKPFIAHTSAHILTSNIGDNGFEGLIFATTYGYCFPHIQPRFSSQYLSPNDIGDDFYGRAGNFEFLEEVECVPFGFSAIYQIGSDVPVAYRSFGGINSENVHFIDCRDAYLKCWIPIGSSARVPVKDIMQTRDIEFSVNSASLDLSEDILFPVGEGFYSMDKFGRLSFFNSNRQKIADDIPVHKDFFHIEIEQGECISENFEFTSFKGGSTLPTLRFNDKPFLHCKVYTPDGVVTDKIMITSSEQEKFLFDDFDHKATFLKKFTL